MCAYLSTNWCGGLHVILLVFAFVCSSILSNLKFSGLSGEVFLLLIFVVTIFSSKEISLSS